MIRRKPTRAKLGLETLESRQVLSAAPTGELQYALELINLTRTNPAAAAERLTANLSEATKGTLSFYGVNLDQAKREIRAAEPRQPLAWSDELAQAADTHSQDMASKGFQSHTGSDGSSPADRAIKAGYTDSDRIAENAFAYSESIDQAIQAFVIDWGVADKGHRRNILEQDRSNDDSFREVGFGVVRSRGLNSNARVVTQVLGTRKNAQAQLLGVVYDDTDKNGFYGIGEGRGDVTIEVTGANGFKRTIESADAGGYQTPLAPGAYTVRAYQNGKLVGSREVRVNRLNVKVDFVTSEANTPAPSSSTPTQSSAATQARSTPQRSTRPAPVAVTRPTASTPAPAQSTPKPAPAVRVVTQAADDDAPATGMAPSLAPAPVRVSIPVVTSSPAVTVLSNLTSDPSELESPVPATLTNADGFSWTSWKPGVRG